MLDYLFDYLLITSKTKKPRNPDFIKVFWTKKVARGGFEASLPHKNPINKGVHNIIFLLCAHLCSMCNGVAACGVKAPGSAIPPAPGAGA